MIGKEKAKGIELKLKDFIPIAGLFSYNLRRRPYVRDECHTPKDLLMAELSILPRFGAIAAYNLALFYGLGYLAERLMR